MGKLQGKVKDKTLIVERDFFINWLEILAPKTKVSLLAWILLYQKYGTDIFYIFNLMAGISIKLPSHRTIMEAYKVAKTKQDYTKYLEIPLMDDDNE